jgi:hypothetical protein
MLREPTFVESDGVQGIGVRVGVAVAVAVGVGVGVAASVGVGVPGPGVTVGVGVLFGPPAGSVAPGGVGVGVGVTEGVTPAWLGCGVFVGVGVAVLAAAEGLPSPSDCCAELSSSAKGENGLAGTRTAPSMSSAAMPPPTTRRTPRSMNFSPKVGLSSSPSSPSGGDIAVGWWRDIATAGAAGGGPGPLAHQAVEDVRLHMRRDTDRRECAECGERRQLLLAFLALLAPGDVAVHELADVGGHTLDGGHSEQRIEVVAVAPSVLEHDEGSDRVFDGLL